jgi:ABC-type nitrate/sulfonate/bicarbonate transport system permease component
MTVLSPSTSTAPADAAGAERGRLLSRDVVIGTMALLACLLLWQGLASSGLVSNLILPGPRELVGRAVYLAGSTCNPPFQLERDIGFTLLRLLGGFALAVALAIPIGIASALSRAVARLLTPILAIFMSIPALAFVPILMLLTGIGEATDFTVVVIAAFVPIAVYVYEGVRLIDTKYFWTASAFGASRRAVFRHVILPAAVVPLVGGFRMGMGYAWRSLIATESLTALTGGLGYTIFQSSQFFDTQTVYLYMVVIAVLGFAIESCFRAVESRTAVRWGVLASRGQ